MKKNQQKQAMVEKNTILIKNGKKNWEHATPHFSLNLITIPYLYFIYPEKIKMT